MLSSSSSSQLVQFLPLILIFVVFYVLLIRPQQKQQNVLKQQLSQLKRGDKVVTAGGIVGTVARVQDDTSEIDIDIAPNVRVSVVRSTIASVMTPKIANDAKPG